MCVFGNYVWIGYIGIFIVNEVKNVIYSSVCILLMMWMFRMLKFLVLNLWIRRVGILVVLVFMNIVIIVISIRIELRKV